jgi:hypothetical protein
VSIITADNLDVINSEIIQLINNCESQKTLTVEDIRKIKKYSQYFTPDQIFVIQNALKSEVAKKVKEYKSKTGLEPIINPLKNITKTSYKKGLGPFIRAWVEAEYLLRNDSLWREFDKGKIDYDTLINKTIKVFNELYSII